MGTSFQTDSTRDAGLHLHVPASTLLGLLFALPVGALIGWFAASFTRPAEAPSATRPAQTRADPASPARPSSSDGRSYRGQPGPWGDLEYIRISIERPDEFLVSDYPSSYQTRWFFPGTSTQQLTQILSQPDISPEQRRLLLDPKKWQQTPHGIFVNPGNEIILGLGSNARNRLYALLAQSPTNQWHFPAFAWRQELMAEWFESSGLSPKTLATAQSLLYRRGNSLCFSDPVALGQSIANPAERARLWKTLSRQATLLAKLRIHPDSDIDALVRYWGREGRAKDVRPLLESLARAPGSASIDLSHLMSPFARKRLYTYPFPPPDAGAPRWNCFYTALNYFREEPDDRFCDAGAALKTLDKDYYPLPTYDPTHGDVIAVFDSGGQFVHAAVYIADEIVFTKNGSHFNQPWLLMDFGDMMAMYPSETPLKTVAYRLKRS